MICVTAAKGKPIKAKTVGQEGVCGRGQDNVVTWASARRHRKDLPGGGCRRGGFRIKTVNRIILTRPGSAGERLGFSVRRFAEQGGSIPVSAVRRPVHMLGAETYQKYLERGTLSKAPLAYMRGTLDDSFIILDEAQNTSREQMKMFLTRLGFGSRSSSPAT